MASKKLFNNPDSQEREYTRLLLKYSKQLQADVNRVLMPRIDDIILQFKVETRTDSWVDTLDALIAELGVLALNATGAVFAKLPGLFTAISKFNEGQFRMVVKANTGLPLPPVMPGAPSSTILGVNVFRSEPFLKPLSDGWVSENTSLIKSLPTRLHPELEGIVRRGVTNGLSVKTIKDQIKARYGVTDYRAKLIAQDQTLKLNANLTRYRLQSVGVGKYVWRSVQDSRVRPEHVHLNGKEFAFDKPPSEGNPGHPVRCRCRAEAIWDEDEDTADNTVALDGRTIPITLSAFDKKDGFELVKVKTAAFDAAWKRSSDNPFVAATYIGPGGEGEIRGRYARFADFISKAKSVEASTLYVSADGAVSFGNGRHRFSYLRDRGILEIPVAMDSESVAAAKKSGLVAN